ncbi:MAG: hypothetical protein JRG80_21075 [Deltaproteobacteria bacterium]|nr:hypothetical protein [Deltaproteobacteria bacterium]MBW2401713.1 hypothetical protein [Deltaproteobacteria bacterium]MBW2664862.1 hypothetical protein [Deltaproteobacteria bacterium]
MKSFAVALLAFIIITAGLDAEARADGAAALRARHRAIAAVQPLGATVPPFAIETGGGDGLARGNVFTTVPHGFAALTDVLRRPSNWCEITSLHLNVKSCTWSEAKAVPRITLYSGRKTYERPEDAYALSYAFELIEDGDDYFRVLLTGDDGPLGTRDYSIELEAIPVGEGESFVRLSYAYRYGLRARMAFASYFATLGSGKVGFSVVGADAQGNAVYVDGMAGMIERNAVRYQLAIQAYLDTCELPESQRFEHRIARWFSLTERHRRQLYELEQEQYLQNKRREYSDQLRLQQAQGTATLQP